MILVDDTAVKLKISKQFPVLLIPKMLIFETPKDKLRGLPFFFNLKKLKVFDIGHLGDYLIHLDL